MVYDNLINNILESYKQILGDNLVGVYLHGSYVMTGFNPKVSDIDFLVVVRREVRNYDKHKLIRVLLNAENEVPYKGIEISMMNLDDTKRPKKPTKFLLHYSDYHKKRYQTDTDYICAGEDDPDLLAHMTVIKARGKCIYGLSIDEVFGDVESNHYLDAIMYDLNEAREGIDSDFEYYILNICRSICYLREEKICSKYEGGQWALENLQSKYKELIGLALDKYTSRINEVNASKKLIDEFLSESFDEFDNCLKKQES